MNIATANFRDDLGSRAQMCEWFRSRAVAIPAGPYVIGSSPRSSPVYCGETPEHRVVLSPFALSATSVTNAQFRRWRPSHAPSAADSLPAVDVTWYDAVQFCDWVGGRLPTEAEWEAAASRQTAEPLTSLAWFCENSGSKAQPVGTRAASLDGCFDLLGNVWEWVYDRYDPEFYARSPLADPVNAASIGDRVCRGGAANSFEDMCRSGYRHHEPADYWAGDIGFRIAFSGRTEHR